MYAAYAPPSITAGAGARPAGITWMQRVKRVFAIDIETCRRCGGRLVVLASIEVWSSPAFVDG